MRRRNLPNKSKGFSLVELMIVVVIIAIVSSIGLPAYRSYVETANMTKTSSAYENAIRMVQKEFTKDTTRMAVGLQTTLPTSDEEWIAILDQGGVATAPGGGPMYVSGKKGKIGQGALDEVGAVSVHYLPSDGQVVIRRPKYLSLTGFRAVIERYSIDITEAP